VATTGAEIEDIMADLAAVFPERVRDLGEEGWQAMCAVYGEVLGDIPAELLQTAALQCLATVRFFPRPAEIREAALELVMTALAIPNANDAWAEVCDWARLAYRRKSGREGMVLGKLMEYDSIKGSCSIRVPTASDWSHPLIQKALDGIGGWSRFRNSDNPIADRSQFIAAYERYALREMEIARMLPQTRQAVLALRERLAGQQPAGFLDPPEKTESEEPE
jgi:hypothetical protein